MVRTGIFSKIKSITVRAALVAVTVISHQQAVSALVANEDFGYTVAPDTSSTSTYPVGTPTGNFSVSPLGASTYSIKIDAPQGLVGMQPSVAIVYNSQSGNGVAGLGTNISGVSVITRGPRTVYADGKAGGITHTKDDAFYLDGQRLILREHIEGRDSSVYCLENNPFVHVVLHGLSGSSQGSMWFSVLDETGTRWEYGHSSGRQQYYLNGTLKVNAWYVSRCENPVGNYMTFGYKSDCYYLYPETINYGRNSHSGEGLSNSINFEYELRYGDFIHFSLEGIQGSVRYRLKTVTTKTGDSVYRIYTLNYNAASLSGFSRLVSVYETNGNGNSLRPITLGWESLGGLSVQQQALPVSTTPIQGTIDHDKSFYSCGDLNGDGLADIFEKAYINFSQSYLQDHYVYRIHTAYRNSDGSIGYSAGAEQPIDPGYYFGDGFYQTYSSPAVIDLDGDGNAEVIVPERKDTPDANFIAFRFFGSCGYKEGFSYDMTTHGTDNFCYNIGDLNNDGHCEAVIIEKHQVSGYYVGAVMGAVTLDNTFTKPFHFTLASEPKDMCVADINLDGLADIIVFHENGYAIYWNDGTWLDNNTAVCTPLYTSYTLAVSPARAFPGDFNGDGITDFLVTVADTTTWYLYIGRGDGTYTQNTACTINAYDQSATAKDDNMLGCYVYDMDGDGKSDAVICKGMFSPHGGTIFEQTYYRHDKTYTYWLRSNGSSLQQVKMATSLREQDASLHHYMIGDFNGDGLPELANKGYDCYNGNNADTDPAWHIYKNAAYSPSADKLKSITDGFGASTSIAYKPLSDNSIYTPTTPTATPDSAIVSCPPLLHVVSSVTIDNGVAGQQTVSYQYGGLKAHLKGKGLLGMSYTKATNTSLGTSTVSGVTRWNCESLLPEQIYTKQFMGGDSTQTVTLYATARPYTQKAWFTYPYHSSTTDMDGNVSSVVTNYQTQYGYLLSRQESWDDGASTYTRYYNHNYYSGRRLPSLAEVEKHVPGTADITRWSYLEYDNYGQNTLLTTDLYSEKPLTRTYTYDSCGNLTTETVSGSGVSTSTKTYTYDATRRFVARTAETVGSLSLVNTATYDTWGHLLTETVRTTGNNPQTTTHSYDQWGNRTRTVQPTGQVTAYRRGWGSSTDKKYYMLEQGTAIPWEKTWYDHCGRKTRLESRGPLDVSITRSWEYDIHGRVTGTMATVGNQSQSEGMSYDYRGRVAAHLFADGKALSYTYGNRSVCETDGAGRSYTKTYDPRGKLLTSTDPSGTVSYTYNAEGQPLTVTAHGATVTIGYDDRGNRNMLADPDAGTQQYVHDALGRVISQTDARGNTTTYSYDGFGNLTATAVNGQPYAAYTYSYTGPTAGMLESESAGGATISYTYDSCDRLSTKTYSLANAGQAQPLQYTYTYGQNGLLQGITYPGNLTVGYSYDSYGNKIATTSGGTTVWQLNYYDGITTVIDHVGQMSSGTSLDSHGRIAELAFMNGLETPGYMTFTYDTATGNLLSRWSEPDGEEMFAYDSLDRLTGAGDEVFSYADNGNLTYKTGIGHYDYASAKPHAVTCIENTARLMDLGRLNTEFNAIGKVSRITNDNRLRMDFIYGPGDERYCTTLYNQGGGIDRRTIYLDGLDIITNDVGDQWWWYYVDDHVVSLRKNGGAVNHYFTFADHLGSIRKVFDADGNERFTVSYDAWGRQTVTRNLLATFPRGYTGHEMLPEFGLINMNGRLYDPLLGRFLSADNFVQEPGSTQSFNRYSYCLNNPLKYTDPDGEVWWIALGALIGGVGNVAIKAFNGQINGWEDGVAAFGIGALAGAVGAATGNAAIALLGTSTGSFGGAVFVGTLSATYSVPTQNLGNHMYFGDPMMTGGEFVSEVALSGLSSGIVNGIGNEIGGRNFFSGKVKMPKANISIDIKPIDPLHSNEIIKSLPQEKKLPETINISESRSFFEGTTYTERAMSKMNAIKADYHTFPRSVEAFEKYGTIRTITGGDGIKRMKLEIPGWYKGKNGYFEFIKEPDNKINHHFFKVRH